MIKPAVFSPSATEAWSRCPWKWWLEREGWRDSRLEKKNVAALMGDAFTLALSHYNRVVRDRGWEAARAKEQHPHYIDAALALFDQSVQHALDNGQSFADEALLAEAPVVLRTTLPKFIADDPTPTTYEVVAIEEPRPEHGWSRCDVVYLRPDGTIEVVDYKLKKALDARYVAETLEEYQEGAQRWHYTWAENAARVSFYVAVSAPFRVLHVPCDRDEARLAQWLESQRPKWTLMQRQLDGEMPLWEADQHKDKWGWCPFKEPCLVHGRDRGRMAASGFVQIKRGRRG